MKKILFLLFVAVVLSACLFGLFDKTPEGMVFVEGGQFTMSNYGSADTFQVQISSYYIAEKEVSMADILIWVNAIGLDASGNYKGFSLLDIYSYSCPYVYQDSQWVAQSFPNHRLESASAVYVSWYAACMFCNWLSNESGRDSVYTFDGIAVSANHSKNGYRLPTEAEWEYAAREGAQSENKYSGTNYIDSLSNFAWYVDNAYSVTPADFEYGVHPSGKKQANGLGIYDMSGNVAEWCWDNYGIFPMVAQVDPMGSSFGTDKVCRGGGWDMLANYCEIKYRLFTHPISRYHQLGFRMAMSYLDN